MLGRPHFLIAVSATLVLLGGICGVLFWDTPCVSPTARSANDASSRSGVRTLPRKDARLTLRRPKRAGAAAATRAHQRTSSSLQRGAKQPRKSSSRVLRLRTGSKSPSARVFPSKRSASSASRPLSAPRVAGNSGRPSPVRYFPSAGRTAAPRFVKSVGVEDWIAPSSGPARSSLSTIDGRRARRASARSEGEDTELTDKAAAASAAVVHRTVVGRHRDIEPDERRPQLAPRTEIRGEAYVGSLAEPLVHETLEYEFLGRTRTVLSGIVETDGRGGFGLPLPPTHHEKATKVKLVCDGCLELVRTIRGIPGNLRVVFPPFSGRRTGTVVDLDGLPVPYATVQLEASDPAKRSTRSADRYGVFALDGWPSGSQRVKVGYLSYRGKREKTVKVRLKGRAEHVSVVVDTGYTLRVQVLDSFGNLVRDASLWARLRAKGTSARWYPLGTVGRSGFPETLIDEGGRLFVADLPASGVLEMAGWGSYRSPAGANSLYGGVTFELDKIRELGEVHLVLEPVRRVQLHVVDEQGFPVAGAAATQRTLSVSPSTSGEFRQFILGSGSPLQAGLYELKVAPQIERSVTILSSAGGATLDAGALRKMDGYELVTVGRKQFITGEVKKRGELVGLSCAAVTVELEKGSPRRFVTGRSGMFCVYVGAAKVRKIVVRWQGQVKEVGRPLRGRLIEVVMD